MANKNQVINEEGNAYTRLTVIKRGPDKLQTDGKFRAQWWCECNCGFLCVLVLGKQLRNGRTKSCGCIRKEKSRTQQILRNKSSKIKNKNLNEIGNKYGMLTVVKKAPSIKYPNGKTFATYYCKCDCGNPELIIKTGNYLRSKNSLVLHSCGCAEQNRKQISYEKQNPFLQRVEFHKKQLSFYSKAELTGTYINEKTRTQYTCLLHGETHDALPMNMQRGNGLKCCKLFQGSRDSVAAILNGTIRAKEKESFIYAFEMRNYPELVKIGIAVDIDIRPDEEYGDLICAFLVKSRIIAVAIEAALKDMTFNLYEMPDLLSDWGGRTELRRISKKKIEESIEYLLEEYKSLQLWKFLYTHTVVTLQEKDEISKRIGETDPLYEWTE